MSDVHKKNVELFELGDKVKRLADDLLENFNAKQIKLKDIPPHKRNCIFFFTRALKTYGAITALAQEGYGQDISPLLRSLLENLISVKYVLNHLPSADDKAKRLVEYKWVIFKRYISNEKDNVTSEMDPFRKELMSNKSLIEKKVEEFKKEFKITSDKALITWSGRSMRDMAKMISQTLLEEYDSTFRLSSRFSHPSIMGDRQYLDYEDNYIVFSALPSSVGVDSNYVIAMIYLAEFIDIFNTLFGLKTESQIKALKAELKETSETKIYSPKSAKKPSAESSGRKVLEFKIKFQTPPK